MANRPNVVLICVDQWRGDCLGVDGHPLLATPHLDSLAIRGARFRHAYSATPTCVPARATLYTGSEPIRHGRVGYLDRVPWDYPVTMAGEFSAHGYQTQAIGKMHVYPERNLLGFHHVLLHDGYLHAARLRHRPFAFIDDYLPWLRAKAGSDAAADYVDNGLNCNSVVARPWDKAEWLHPTTWVATHGIDFLYRRDPAKPFFLYLSFHRPHPPYDPPTWAFEQYLDTPPYRPVVGDWFDAYEEWAQDHRHDAHVARFPARTLHRARAGYYGHMAHIEMQINRFWEALAEFGLADNTYFCFVSDHGEMLGDHHLFRKGYPYEGSARIPFILSGPTDSGIVPGIVRDEVVELRDVLPTLLDCAGLPVPDQVDGRSVLGLARGETSPWREWLHGEHTLFGQSVQWITNGREKYIWMSGSGREQLFDLDSDPGEEHDLSREPASADRVERWRSVLTEELRDREERFVEDGKLAIGRPVYPVLRHLREKVS